MHKISLWWYHNCRYLPHAGYFTQWNNIHTKLFTQYCNSKKVFKKWKWWSKGTQLSKLWYSSTILYLKRCDLMVFACQCFLKIRKLIFYFILQRILRQYSIIKSINISAEEQWAFILSGRNTMCVLPPSEFSTASENF